MKEGKYLTSKTKAHYMCQHFKMSPIHLGHPVEKVVKKSSSISSLCPNQVEQDKAKLLYELDELQAQMEKSQHSANRTLTEAEDYRMDAERQREKCDKLQVSCY